MRAGELSRSESGTHAVRRIVRQRISNALDCLHASKLSDEAVHAARKELKKARATLRLLRGVLSDSTYKRENAVLRDAARPLSAVRDGKALLDTLNKLVERYGVPANAVPVEGFRVALRRQRFNARHRILSRSASLGAERAALRKSHEHAARWRVGRNGWSVIGSGLKRTYGKGRKALAAAQSDRSIEDLHEWRKQTKYLWHQLRILQPLWSGLIGELADQVHKLSDYLGDDHDLAVLREKALESEKSFASAAARSALIALIDRCRAELQDKAIVLGRRIYEEKPKAFIGRFGKYWHDWNSQPEVH